jgi:hypothetical protein
MWPNKENFDLGLKIEPEKTHAAFSWKVFWMRKLLSSRVSQSRL